MELTQKKCIPCEKGTTPFNETEIKAYARKLRAKWDVEDGKKIKRKFKFTDFRETIAFVNRIAEVAEEERHHPDLFITWNILEVTLWTHAIGGLSENDFILAAKIDELYERIPR
ncbi:MAG TPA: 4a-hydroxytetrahydrobiopterin dehydratase [Chitinophagales bacterium]|nr:4a-hydroxytetrahydrobiopterin dehydratase [Chitinophagales bacterium]